MEMMEVKEQAVDVPLGRWTKTALRSLPRGVGTWSGLRSKAYDFSIGTKCPVLATIRRQGRNGWLTQIEGFEWIITEDMGISRFRGIPGGALLTHTPVKTFRTSMLAKDEVAHILATAPIGL